MKIYFFSSSFADSFLYFYSVNSAKVGILMHLSVVFLNDSDSLGNKLQHTCTIHLKFQTLFVMKILEEFWPSSTVYCMTGGPYFLLNKSLIIYLY